MEGHATHNWESKQLIAEIDKLLLFRSKARKPFQIRH